MTASHRATLAKRFGSWTRTRRALSLTQGWSLSESRTCRPGRPEVSCPSGTSPNGLLYRLPRCSVGPTGQRPTDGTRECAPEWRTTSGGSGCWARPTEPSSRSQALWSTTAYAQGLALEPAPTQKTSPSLASTSLPTTRLEFCASCCAGHGLPRTRPSPTRLGRGPTNGSFAGGAELCDDGSGGSSRGSDDAPLRRRRSHGARRPTASVRREAARSMPGVELVTGQPQGGCHGPQASALIQSARPRARTRPLPSRHP